MLCIDSTNTINNIIRELQPALCQCYNIDCSIQVAVEVSSIMAAYFVRSAIKGPEYFNNDLYIAINIVTLTKCRL